MPYLPLCEYSYNADVNAAHLGDNVPAACATADAAPRERVTRASNAASGVRNTHLHICRPPPPFHYTHFLLAPHIQRKRHSWEAFCPHPSAVTSFMSSHPVCLLQTVSVLCWRKGKEKSRSPASSLLPLRKEREELLRTLDLPLPVPQKEGLAAGGQHHAGGIAHRGDVVLPFCRLPFMPDVQTALSTPGILVRACAA